MKIEERVKEQEKTAQLVQQTRENYVPVAVRSSAMFFVIADLCKARGLLVGVISASRCARPP